MNLSAVRNDPAYKKIKEEIDNEYNEYILCLAAPKKEKQNLLPFAIGALIILALVSFLLFRGLRQEKNFVSPAPLPEITLEVQIPQINIIQKAEGEEHSFIRQLIADPIAFGFAGDVKKGNELKKWANRKAHLIAIEFGYVDAKTGKEIRIKGKGNDTAVKLVASADKTVKKVEEYSKNNDGKFKLTITRDAGDQFIGNIQGSDGIQAYQYVFAPNPP